MVMEKSLKGVVNNAFYKRNVHSDTKNTFWGRTQGPNVELFEYKEDEEGKLVIIEKDN